MLNEEEVMNVHALLHLRRVMDLGIVLDGLITTFCQVDIADTECIEKNVRTLSSLIRTTEKVHAMIQDKGKGSLPGEKKATERVTQTRDDAEKLRHEIERRLARLEKAERKKKISGTAE